MSIPTAVAHHGRLIQNAIAHKQSHPLGNYEHTPYQWGVVDAINPGPPPSVNVYLDGSQMFNDPGQITQNIRYLDTYHPTVGDVVVVCRNTGKSSSDRWVMGKLSGSTTPSPVILENLVSGQYVAGPNGLWGGSGTPGTALGQDGDFYFNSTGTTGNRIFIKQSGAWIALI